MAFKVMYSDGYVAEFVSGRDGELMGSLFKENENGSLTMVPKTSGWYRTKEPHLAGMYARDAADLPFLKETEIKNA